MVSFDKGVETFSEDSIAMISQFLSQGLTEKKSAETLSEQLFKGAEDGGEITGMFIDWFENRLKPQTLWLDKDDYAKALVRALWLAPRFAGTDFGSSRQRDMAQVWTDTARGFLGEIALSKYLLSEFNLDTRLDTRRGKLVDFLPTDVAEVRFPGEDWRPPKVKISLKTTKFNGRWLDLPGAQFGHSDVYVLVKLGILRQHFLAFLKAISFLKDKLFQTAKKLGELDDDNAKELWDEIPIFDAIPAYVAGFLFKDGLQMPIQEVSLRAKGTKKKRIVVSRGVGLFSPETIRARKEAQQIDPNNTLPIEIEPIIDSLSGQHFLANSGALRFEKNEWQSLVEKT